MANWRTVKAGARRVVQTTMQIPFAYYAGGAIDSNSGAVAQVVRGRLHLDDKALGDQAGTNLNSAERHEPIPKAIFWVADLVTAGVTLTRLDVLVVAPGEAYEVDHVEPHDVETITVHVSRMPAASATPYAPPAVT